MYSEEYGFVSSVTVKARSRKLHSQRVSTALNYSRNNAFWPKQFCPEEALLQYQSKQIRYDPIYEMVYLLAIRSWRKSQFNLAHGTKNEK